MLVHSDAAPLSLRAAQRVCTLFRDVRQASQAIRALLRPVDLDDLWTDVGPTRHARQMFREYGSTLTATEWTLLSAAFDLWDGVSDVELSRLDDLDIDHARSLCTLVMAVKEGPDAIDLWLAELPEGDRPERQQPGQTRGLRQTG